MPTANAHIHSLTDVLTKPKAVDGVPALQFSTEKLNPAVVAAGIAPAKLEELPIPGGFSRLVILIPEYGLDEDGLGSKIWSLASQNSLSVLLVAMVVNPENAPKAKRSLTTIASIARGPRVRVEITWMHPKMIETVLPVSLTPSDLLVCPSNFQIQKRNGTSTQLSQRLETVLHQPVLTYESAAIEDQPAPPQWMRVIAYWAGVAAILIGFLLLEANINKLMTNWIGTLMSIIMILLEVGALILWNRFLG
jgi:hypothetical protein